MKSRKLRKAIAQALGLVALAGLSSQAAASNTQNAPGSVVLSQIGQSYTATGNAPFRAWADYGAEVNLGWTHTAHFYFFRIGSDDDITAGNRFDVNISLQGVGANPMNSPAFSLWTSGTTPTTDPTGGHEWNQVRGATGTNDYFTSGGILPSQDGWVGYANAGYSFFNRDGDHVGGLLTPGAGNLDYSAQLALSGNPPTIANVNPSSPWVEGGSALLENASASLSLTGLRSGYYFLGLGGSCPDGNLNGQNCRVPQAVGYQLTVTAVPLPAAAWLFGSGLLGLAGLRRKKAVTNA